ncbi:MAG: type II toxin-antitoxin system HicA family toxin [Stellaceae bacterium]
MIRIEHETCALLLSYNIHVVSMTAGELRRWLAKQGCTFETHKGGSGHLTVVRDDRRSQLPMHGSNKELGTRLVAKIKKDLGLD